MADTKLNKVSLTSREALFWAIAAQLSAAKESAKKTERKALREAS
jgi:hypothetical protein